MLQRDFKLWNSLFYSPPSRGLHVTRCESRPIRCPNLLPTAIGPGTHMWPKWGLSEPLQDLSVGASREVSCLFPVPERWQDESGLSEAVYLSVLGNPVAGVNKDKQRQADEGRGEKVLEPSIPAISVISLMSQWILFVFKLIYTESWLKQPKEPWQMILVETDYLHE